MDAPVAVGEPASHQGWRSIRSNLQLILVILLACAWDASAMLVMEINWVQPTFEWLPRLWKQLQASVLFIAPGIVAARLAAGGYPTSLRMCFRAVVGFILGSVVGHWLVFQLVPAHAPGEFRGVWPLISYAQSLLTNTLFAAAVVGGCIGGVAKGSSARSCIAREWV